MQNIQTPQDLKIRLDQKNPSDILLDVRTPEEYSGGHIKGSTNFNISSSDVVNKIQKLDKSKTYILYCRSGGRSQMAAMIMAQNGLDVINCQFGFMHLGGGELEISN
jgi:rhodanese-related sulfurtransferase